MVAMQNCCQPVFQIKTNQKQRWAAKDPTGQRFHAHQRPDPVLILIASLGLHNIWLIIGPRWTSDANLLFFILHNVSWTPLRAQLET